jgi:hypothetical protein
MPESYQPLQIPPGIFRNATQYQTSGRWYDCNLVRWVDGVVRPVGGWTHFTLSPVGTVDRPFQWTFTFTTSITSGLTSATLSVVWPFATGSYTVTFSDGSTRSCTLTNGATTCTWAGSGITATSNGAVAGSLKFTASLTAAQSGTLSVNWTGTTGTSWVTFSDGSRRLCTLTNGAATCTWTGAVTATQFATVENSRTAGVNKGYLAATWDGASGTFPVVFTSGDVANATFVHGSNSVTWDGAGLSAPATFSSIATGSVCRALHAWQTNGGVPFLAIGTSAYLFVNGGDNIIKDITPAAFVAGSDDAYAPGGYGGGAYGTYGGTPPNLYGTARVSNVFLPPTVWHLDNFGENLVACAPNPAGGGQIFQWQLDYTTPTPATVIAEAPALCAGIAVSDQRHLMAFGAGGNKRLVQWCDSENYHLWTPDPTNEAGDFEFQTVGSFVKAVSIRGQMLVLYTTDAHVMNYLGQPFVFGRERVGVDCGPIGTGAVAVTGAFVGWMGQKRFWSYDGGAVNPLQSDVADYVFGRLNNVQAFKTTAAHNGEFGEIWWFYPSGQSDEPNSYCIWNYRENHWSIGEIGRSAWVDSGVFQYPTAVDPNGILMRHEQGYLADNVSMFGTIYAETGALEIPPAGDNIMAITRVLPDEKTSGQVTVSFRSRFTPNGTEYSYGPYTVRSDGYTDTRLSGRQIVMRIQPTIDGEWRVGTFRIAAVSLGTR